MKKLFYILCLMTVSVSLMAEQRKDWGRVSASLESMNHFYVEDPANDFFPLTGSNPQFRYLNGSRYASNNYLKVDYYKGRISAGLQLEGYFPATVGYPIAESMLSLSNLYVSWTDRDYSVTVGTFYDQLGSGLLFRSWEDRPLGLNNAVLGARATYSFRDILDVKVFGGVPRMGKVSVGTHNTHVVKTPVFGLGLTDTVLAAADMGLSLSECLGWDRVLLSLEGSVLYKYEQMSEYLLLKDSGPIIQDGQVVSTWMSTAFILKVNMWMQGCRTICPPMPAGPMPSSLNLDITPVVWDCPCLPGVCSI